MRCIWNVKECMRPTRYEGVSECMLYLGVLPFRTVDEDVRAACHTREQASCPGSFDQSGASPFFDAVSGRSHSET
jgi:hypothetical protein